MLSDLLHFNRLWQCKTLPGGLHICRRACHKIERHGLRQRGQTRFVGLVVTDHIVTVRPGHRRKEQGRVIRFEGQEEDGAGLFFFQEGEEFFPEGGLGLAFQGAAGEGEMAVHVGNGYAHTFEAVVDGKVFHDITA